MALMPKRVKHRKSQRGRIKGNATRGNRVVFGEYGLQAIEGGWVSAATIEAGRVAATQYIRGEGRLYVRVFPHKSITSIPLTLQGLLDLIKQLELHVAKNALPPPVTPAPAALPLLA